VRSTLEDVRSMEGLERLFACMLLCETFKMDAASLTTTLAFDSSASATADGARLDVALGDLVPPLLLGSAPDLLAVTGDAGERLIDIVAARDEGRSAVAV